MVERIAYKGKYSADLVGLKTEEYMKMLKSRQRRSMARNAVKYRKLIAKAEDAAKSGRSKPIKTHVREAVIIPQWIGMKFAVHNGKEFKEMTIQANMLGHRLGEFAFSTKRVLHSAPGIRATRGSKFLAVK